jgi:predicted XRE-type DNA-binding protein
MGNAYPTSGHRTEFSNSSSVHQDSAWDQEADTDRASLIEENARLRALVVQLSNLVLRNVVDQSSTSSLLPARRSLPD